MSKAKIALVLAALLATPQGKLKVAGYSPLP